MTTGNSVAMTVNKAAMAQAPVQSDCEELEGDNNARRGHMEERTQDKSLRNKNGLDDQEGTTISSCKFQRANGNTATRASAHSSGRAYELSPSQFVSGGSDEVRSGQAPVMCSDDARHKPPYKQKSGHAEARILDALGNQKGLKMAFKIDWRNGKGEYSNLPCEDCQRLLCIAMKDCKDEIWLCNDENEPQQLDENDCGMDEKGNITPQARNNLMLKMM